MTYHQPVLLNEIILALDPQLGKTFVDATLGNGGHTLALLEKKAKVIAFENDENNIKIVQQRIKNKNLKIIHDNFINLDCHLSQKVDGILFDLGLSVNQQKSENRGFSFNDEESLDMRLNPQRQNTTAEEIINTYHYQELFDIFSKYSQEKFSKPLALKIIKERQKSPIKTGKQLADIIRNFYQDKHCKSKINPATKIFMSLRIAVNNEFDNLKKALHKSLNLIKKDGTIAVISFHSGEDRIVKQFIKQNHLNGGKPIYPSPQEIKNNPLSRSSILRCFKIS
jgi:16S rRNA (cytosine1402-N4)-methyltransferase